MILSVQNEQKTAPSVVKRRSQDGHFQRRGLAHMGQDGSNPLASVFDFEKQYSGFEQIIT